MNRNFGIEMEFGVNTKKLNAINVVSRRLNEVCSVSLESYNHRTSASWKITTDSSVKYVSNTHGKLFNSGYELVSPILNESRLPELKEICRVLNELENENYIQINKSCGLHIHIDGRDLNSQSLTNICRFYQKYELAFDSIMPKSRRINSYCQSVRSESFENVISHVNDLRGNTDYDARYHKLNLMSYLRHGTVEFRQHSGTISYDKIVNWLKVVQNVVEHCATVNTIKVTKTSNSYNIVKDSSYHMFRTLEIKGELKKFFTKRQNELGSLV